MKGDIQIIFDKKINDFLTRAKASGDFSVLEFFLDSSVSKLHPEVMSPAPYLNIHACNFSGKNTTSDLQKAFEIYNNDPDKNFDSIGDILDSIYSWENKFELTDIFGRFPWGDEKMIIFESYIRKSLKNNSSFLKGVSDIFLVGFGSDVRRL